MTVTTPHSWKPSGDPRPHDDVLGQIDRWWRAANYLSVGQIYLLDNPLLRNAAVPRRRQTPAARALGHHPGAELPLRPPQPGDQQRQQSTIYITGPGHGGPGLVANAYLDGTYTETYPDITRDAEGLRRLFRQFSFPGGIPSHVAPETPGLHPRGR